MPESQSFRADFVPVLKDPSDIPAIAKVVGSWRLDDLVATVYLVCPNCQRQHIEYGNMIVAGIWVASSPEARARVVAYQDPRTVLEHQMYPYDLPRTCVGCHATIRMTRDTMKSVLDEASRYVPTASVATPA